MKIAIVVGTRPEIIKMSPVIRVLQSKDVPYYVLHTGQHYSYNMDRLFFEELELPQPDYNLDIGERFRGHGAQTGEMMKEMEEIFSKDRPDVVLVQGDTNTVLAGAITASKLHIKVGHVEAGLRSHDRSMPEEINRILADHASDYLFAPTERSAGNLRKEGIEEEKISVTGNTVVDAVHQNLEIARRKGGILEQFGLEDRNYILITAHRQENVDDRGRLSGIVSILNSLEMPAIFPMHPRTVNRMKEFGLEVDNPLVRVVEPVGYMEFLMLIAHAKVILTDSGGIQEESNILHVPCLTLRDNTERPETVDAGSNVIVGVNPENVVSVLKEILEDVELEKMMRCAPVVFGDGESGKRIFEIVFENIL